MPISLDHSAVEEAIRAVSAEKIIPRFKKLEEGHIRSKTSPGDLVTIADEEAEIELTRIFQGMIPGSVVLGEEAVSSGTASRDILSSHDGPVWIVDPVDGTGNFARGSDVFGTMVALVNRGERIAAWIYQPRREKMVSVECGAGIQINGLPYVPQIMAEQDLRTMKAFISQKFMPPAMRPHVEAQAHLIADMTTYMCCAWEYVELLEGLRTFSIYSRIEPWDHLAGTTLLKEAGFECRLWDESPYDVGILKGGLINAPSQTIWRKTKFFID